MAEDDDLKNCWDDLGANDLIVPPAAPWNMETALEEAATRAAAELSNEVAVLGPNPPLTHALLQRLILSGARLFVQHWLGSLQQQDLGGLLGFMVDGLKLPAEELAEFVRALPASVLRKFVSSHVGSAKGTHALLALEWHRRQDGLQYTVFDKDGMVQVRVTSEKGETTFGLDETFES